MATVGIEFVNELYIRIHAEPSIKMEMSDHFTFTVPNAKFMPSVQNKIWDGKIRLLNIMTGLIYRGLIAEVYKFCQKSEYKVTILNEVDNIKPNDIDENIAYSLAKEYGSTFEPRDYQAYSVYKALKWNRGLFLSPTASGKSFIIYLLTRYFVEQSKRVLIVVPYLTLVNQMASDFVEYNNGNKLNIHKISSGVDKVSDADWTITTWQSIYKMPKKWYEQFDVIVGDEAHMFKATSLLAIMEKTSHIKYRYGFTGSLDDSLTNQLVLQGLFGKIRKVTTTKELIDNETLAKFNIKTLVFSYSDEDRKRLSKVTYQEEIDWIIANKSRNKYICNLAANIKGNTLILFQYVDKHGKILEKMLNEGNKKVYFIHGSVSAEDRELVRKLAEESDDIIILASYGTFSTGVNIKKLDNLIMASPTKSKIRNLQSIGRVLRKGNGKVKATLYDLADDLSWKSKKNTTLNHLLERLKIYNSEKFEYKIFDIDMKG